MKQPNKEHEVGTLWIDVQTLKQPDIGFEILQHKEH
jgi:hypothetical protein